MSTAKKLPLRHSNLPSMGRLLTLLVLISYHLPSVILAQERSIPETIEFILDGTNDIDSASRFFNTRANELSYEDKRLCFALLDDRLGEIYDIELCWYIYFRSPDLSIEEIDSLWLWALEHFVANEPLDTLAYLDALNSYGEHLFTSGRHREAKSYFIEVINTFPQGEIHDELARAHNNLAVTSEKMGKLKAGLPHSRESLSQFTRINGKNNSYVAKVSSNLGLSYTDLGFPDSAIVYHLKSAKVYEKIQQSKSSTAGINLINLGKAYTVAGQVEDALSSYNEAYELNDKLQHKKRKIKILSMIAATKDKFRKLYSSEEIDNQFSLGISEGISMYDISHISLQELYNNFALRQMGVHKDYNRALLLFQKAMRCRYQNKIQKGFDFPFSKSIHTSNPSDLLLFENLALCHTLKARETKNISELYWAQRILNSADSIVDNIRSEVIVQGSRKGIKSSIMRYYMHAKLTPIILYNLTNDSKYLSKIFEYNERSLNWDLAEAYLASSIVKGDTTKRNIAKEMHTLSTKNQDILSSDSVQIEINLRLEDLKMKYPDYLNLLYSSHMSTLDDVKLYCKEQKENCLFYSRHHSQVYSLICVTPDTVIFVQDLGQLKTIKPLVEELSQDIQNRSNFFFDRSKKLYEILIDPVAKHMREGVVNITGDVHLSGLPFGALIQGSTERYLIEDFATAYQPSAYYFLNA